MIITKICPICSKEFETTRNAKKFCTEWCRKKANKKDDSSQLKKCVCTWCGGAFYSMRRKSYCSTTCRMLANGRCSTPRAKKPAPPAVSLEQAVALAHAQGMSYGEYVQKFGL
ncbi:MAG: hypothetical protein IJ365_02075 [Clostridia bacterium]|nr:hypothetical protein [Clostridia bacterium]